MKRIFTILYGLLILTPLFAQDDLMKELEQSENRDTDYAFQTFKGTRLVNGHSVETKAKKNLEFIFAHRFGAVNGGWYEMFGLDEAYVRIGLDYGITDNLSVSIGRNSFDKTLDGYAKYKLIKQSKGLINFPLTITALGSIAYKTSPKKLSSGTTNVDRIAYVGQLLLARKFSPNVSFQIMPTLVHKNAVDQVLENNDQLALGIGGRIKITKSVALTGEYYYRINEDPKDAPANIDSTNPYNNTLGFGIDIETGGHVFQLVMTNTRGLTERSFITETDGDFADGDIHFGFNVTRTFQLKGKK